MGDWAETEYLSEAVARAHEACVETRTSAPAATARAEHQGGDAVRRSMHARLGDQPSRLGLHLEQLVTDLLARVAVLRHFGASIVLIEAIGAVIELAAQRVVVGLVFATIFAALDVEIAVDAHLQLATHLLAIDGFADCRATAGAGQERESQERNGGEMTNDEWHDQRWSTFRSTLPRPRNAQYGGGYAGQRDECPPARLGHSSGALT